MKSSSSPSPVIPDDHAVETARSLRKLYFIRAAFSIVWVILLHLLYGRSVAWVSGLLMIYPAWDVIGTLMDIQANRHSASKVPQYVNAAISALTTLVVGFALQKGYRKRW